MPRAEGGRLRLQKKIVRSMVEAQRVPVECWAMMVPMSNKEGKWKVGRGLGESSFTPLRSAIKAALDVDFGRRKADVFGRCGHLLRE